MPPTSEAEPPAGLRDGQDRVAALEQEVHKSREHWQFLADLDQVLTSSADYRSMLNAVVRRSLPELGAWCAIERTGADGKCERLAESGTAPAEGARISLALTTRGRSLGTLIFAPQAGREYGPAELKLAEYLARRVALALDNTLLYEAAQRARSFAESALETVRKNEARFERLVESNIIGIVLTDGEHVQQANQIFLDIVGRARAELTEGKLRVWDLTSPEHHPRDLRMLEELRKQGSCAPFEDEFVHKDGSRVPVLLGAVMLDEEPALFLCFVVDLRERKRLEERLRWSQKLESLGLLAGGVAHDFNNLLTAIIGNASLALEDLDTPSRLQPRLEDLLLAGERATELTRQLLAYSGKGRFVIRPIHLSRLVQEIVSLLQVSIPKKVGLDLQLEEDLPATEGDSGQIQQLVMNLVINAAEAIGDREGVVTIRTSEREIKEQQATGALMPDEIGPGRYLCLEITDDGSGMDAETCARIFDPFFTTKFTGRGLGLAAVQGIVRGHKGAIRVESEPGKGSTFRVLLPASGGTVEARPAKPISLEDLHGEGTVLVVDDEQVVRKTAQLALERYGYQVLVAEDGREGLEQFRAHAGELALVVLDMTMPHVSGAEAVNEMQKIAPAVPVLASSGYSESEAVLRFSESGGMAGFIQKPYTATQLARKVKMILRRD